jgi:hypothetical protein
MPVAQRNLGCLHRAGEVRWRLRSLLRLHQLVRMH